MSNTVTIVLPGLNKKHSLRIPEQNLTEVLSPANVTAEFNLNTLIQRALANPIACSPLAKIVSPGQSILIIVDDITRTTPTAEIAPYLLEYLGQLGVADENITFALALGTHRPMTELEIDIKLGQDIASKFPVINTPAQDATAFVDIGESWGGVPIEVHHAVLEADVVIGIGSVVPHAEAGWSGGCKIVLPGMCSERTVMENHYLAVDFPGNLLGNELTSIRENMEGVVEKIGLDYILNVVMTPYGDVIDVMGGHFVAAQRAAVQAARPIYSVPYSERVDIVVSNAYPAEIDFWQASKGIWAGDLMAKPGGKVILNAPCPEGFGMHHDYMYWSSREPREIVQAVEDNKLTDKNLAGVASEIASILQHLELIVVSQGLAADQVKSCGFAYFDSLQAAFDDSLASAGPSARVGVITHGGYTLPAMKNSSGQQGAGGSTL